MPSPKTPGKPEGFSSIYNSGILRVTKVPTCGKHGYAHVRILLFSHFIPAINYSLITSIVIMFFDAVKSIYFIIIRSLFCNTSPSLEQLEDLGRSSKI